MSESNEVTLENWEEKKIEFRVVDNGVKVVDLTNWEESLEKLYHPSEPKNQGTVDIKVFIKYLLDLKDKEKEAIAKSFDGPYCKYCFHGDLRVYDDGDDSAPNVLCKNCDNWLQ